MKHLSSILLLAACHSAFGQSEAIYTTKEGAIKGYDAVAYFQQGEPVKGQEKYKTEWSGADWYFSSQENQSHFETNPAKYTPQYGGYCAYGVAKGGLFKIDPEAWKIVEGKLYLNYSLKYQKEWEVDIPGHIDSANKNWPSLQKKN